MTKFCGKVPKIFFNSTFQSRPNFIPFSLVREQNLSLCTNIEVTYLSKLESLTWGGEGRSPPTLRVELHTGKLQPCLQIRHRGGNGATTLSVTTLSITTLSIMTLSIMTLSIMTLSIMTLSTMKFSKMTLSITIN